MTKLRHQVFTGTHLTRMEEIMRDVCADFETELTEFNGADNHVHLLVNFPPKVALSKLVNSLKGVTSRRMRQEFPDLAAHYYRTNKLWSGSYFAGERAPVHRAAKPPGLTTATPVRLAAKQLFLPRYAKESASPPA